MIKGGFVFARETMPLQIIITNYEKSMTTRWHVLQESTWKVNEPTLYIDRLEVKFTFEN